MTDQFTVDRRAYLTRFSARKSAARKSVVTQLRTGPWTAAEDAILLRDDLYMVEKMAMLQRSESTISSRSYMLRAGEYRDCLHCGESFLTFPSWRADGTKRYCSPSCVWQAKKAENAARNSATCPICGATFVAMIKNSPGKPNYRQIYCTHKCAVVALRQRPTKNPRPPAYKSCPSCGENFKPRHARSVACSRKCVGRMKTIRAAEINAKNSRVCPTCSIAFIAKAVGSNDGVLRMRKYCSRPCFVASQKKSRPARHCLLCGADFTRKGRGKYCSTGCYHAHTIDSRIERLHRKSAKSSIA